MVVVVFEIQFFQVQGTTPKTVDIFRKVSKRGFGETGELRGRVSKNKIKKMKLFL